MAESSRREMIPVKRYMQFLQSRCGQTSALKSNWVAEGEAHYRAAGCDRLSSSNSSTHALKMALATLNLFGVTTNV